MKNILLKKKSFRILKCKYLATFIYDFKTLYVLVFETPSV